MTLLHHHHNTDYQDQADKAVAFARQKINDIIANGSARAQQTLRMLSEEIPTDIIMDGEKISWEVRDQPYAKIGDREFTLHNHALQQVCSKAGMPITYWRSLEKKGDDWSRKLMEHNLNQLYSHGDGRYLIRCVNDQVRGFLSDSYKRYDSRKLIESFVQAVQRHKAVPVNGYYMDTKVAIKAMLPQTFEPVKNEVLGIGLCLQTSDFGDGAFSISMFAMRLWCTNFAMSENALRKVHLGSKLPDDLSLSARTYELDTQTLASMTNDIVDVCLTDKVDNLLEAVKEASEQEVSWNQVNNFLKKKLNKKEVEHVVTAMKSPDTYNMPEGQTAWRLSNALSWCAQSLEDESKSLDYMKMAGEAIKMGSRSKNLLS